MEINFIKEALYFGAHRLFVGSALGREYVHIREEDKTSAASEKTSQLLGNILNHSLKNVEFYRRWVHPAGEAPNIDPIELLAQFPLLTKEMIRQNLEQLKSDDLPKRRWTYNTSGGSTGEPLRLVQDRHFNDRQMAIQWLSFNWAGRRLGDPAIHLWGSVKDIFQQTEGLDKNILRTVTNDRYLNSFMMTPEKMRSYLHTLNSSPPRLIVAYTQSIFELAQFAEKEGIAVTPQKAIMTSANTLYPFMRQKIEAVFQCKVFNRYGSREVGDIACECSAHAGMHVFPWGNYLEIVDDEGRPVPPGTEGNILVTNLNNFAMPLIRYSIGDRGVISPSGQCICGWHGQILQEITGRITDNFKRRDGTLVYGGYFTHLLFFKDWVQKFQVVQKEYERVVFRIQKTDASYELAELDEIKEKTKIVMGDHCSVDFEFLDQISPASSGKFLYTISEVK